ncbi:MAG: GNAT family N-acetyltransferase [Candidatus Aenigmarchaeota archaeon]|nr:GNAT family N-acetyltransferase [Candidatus Aenigmarchaeota archaeon]
MAEFRQGKTVKTLTLKGREVVFRYPKMSDIDQMWRNYNRMIREGAMLSRNTVIKKKDSREWLESRIKQMRQNKAVQIMVEVEGKIIGSADIKRDPMEVSTHSGDLGIAITKEYRGIGIGPALLDVVCFLAKKRMRLKIVKFTVYSENRHAIHVYEKCGFRKAGVIPKRIYKKGKYIDDIIMYKPL